MSSPSVPDPSAAAISGMKADMANFPMNWLVNSAAQTGGKVTIGDKTYDFTGLGNVAQQNQMSDTMAKALLDIQKNYGADYVKQRLADLKLADPAGFSARKQLFDKIIKDSETAPPNAKMSQDLQTQVDGMLENAGQLDERGRQQVQNQVRGQQVARGITLGNAPASEEATAMVNAQDALRSQQQQSAADYLKSGISPEDIQFRKIQQDLANLGAFSNNQTPEAQFGQLSAAGNGAAPFQTPNYSTPATLNPQQSAQTGMNFANSIYGSSQNVANPWLSAASIGIQGLNTAANMGLFNTAPAYGSTYAGYGGNTYMSVPTAGGGGMSVPIQ